jgi:hypothetical protein
VQAYCGSICPKKHTNNGIKYEKIEWLLEFHKIVFSMVDSIDFLVRGPQMLVYKIRDFRNIKS